MNWSQDSVLKLIKCYRNQPVLWNPKNEGYFNKDLRQKAWGKVAMAMQLSAGICRDKFKSLSCSMRREQMKMRVGTIEKTNWFAYDQMDFMRTRLLHNIKKEPRRATKKQPVRKQAKRTVALLNRERKMQPVVRIEPMVFRPPEPEEDNAGGNSEALVPKTETCDAAEECTQYGQFITSKMKHYSRSTLNTVQYQISNILYEADQGRYEMTPTVIMPSNAQALIQQTPIKIERGELDYDYM